jgi:hypothetical protein
VHEAAPMLEGECTPAAAMEVSPAPPAAAAHHQMLANKRKPAAPPLGGVAANPFIRRPKASKS